MEKKLNEKFKNWLNKLPIGEYSNTVNKLAEHCGVSIFVVRNWKYGRTKIKPAYQKLINTFANKKIL